MKATSLLIFLIACSTMKKLDKDLQPREVYENNLIQCYLESDTYNAKKPFNAKMSIFISDLGTVTDARVISTSSKDANLNACLRYAMMGAGRPLQTKERPGPKVREFKFKPNGKHEL